MIQKILPPKIGRNIYLFIHLCLKNVRFEGNESRYFDAFVCPVLAGYLYPTKAVTPKARTNTAKKNILSKGFCPPYL